MVEKPTFLRKYGPYLAVFALAVIVRLLPGPRTIDDSFITYRYARNLLAGNGFVYNPGVHILGTTTPLYTLTMAFLGLFFGGPGAPFPIIAYVLNALLDGITAMLLLYIGRKLDFGRAGLGAALVWGILPFSVTFAIGGLETSLYVLLLIGTFAALLDSRYVLVGLLSGLALLTRPDALILVLPLGFDRLFFDRKRRGVPLKINELLAFFVPALLWYGFATLYFGSPLPHSITAKTQAYQLPPNGALIRMTQHYATPFMGNLTFGTVWIGIGLVLYPFLYIIGGLNIFRRERHTWPVLLFPWFYFLAFTIPNPLIFRWYLTTPTPFYILIILCGLEQLLSQIFKKAAQNKPIAWQVATLLLVILIPLALPLREWRLHPEDGPDRPAPDMAWVRLEDFYHQAADIVSADVGESAGAYSYTLAAGDVGVLGYYTQARILDTVGLNTAEPLAYYPVPEEMIAGMAYAIPPDLIFDQQPDYLVFPEIYIRNGLLKDERFTDQYTLLEKIETDIYDSDGMLIFVRKP